jgi:hypothetical protein
MANSSSACEHGTCISDKAFGCATIEKWAKKLTYHAEVAIVRRFREYPDRAVGKSQQAEGSRKALAI